MNLDPSKYATIYKLMYPFFVLILTQTLNMPFGRVAEWYISNHSLLKNIRLKCQNRKKISELVNENIIAVSRVEGVVDYIKWNTKKGSTKSTNRIDDIIKLTPEVRVISESKLSWLKKEKPLRIKIIGSHLLINALALHNPIITRLNISRQTKDNIIIIRRADFLGLSNRENSLSIQLAVLAVKNNIHCNNNNCSYEWFIKICQMKKVLEVSESP
uniref:Uncharacterized protein n=1 Tax=Rhizophagus irregularis (strain DAOM 181602 / DAOM 197198 / MUCL 43194) TaxID=747089 RepID=U9SN92_RHIID